MRSKVGGWISGRKGNEIAVTDNSCGRGCIKSRFEDSHGLQSVGNYACNDTIQTVLTASVFTS